MRKKCADDVRVAYPLFQEESGGSTPTSALQLFIDLIPKDIFKKLNKKWHSRLPLSDGCFEGMFFGATFNNIIYAVAWWSSPVARGNNDKNMYELRRMAIAPDAPKYTASYMLGYMRRYIKKKRPDIKTLISYQDTEVHTGTIYKAAGWLPKDRSTVGNLGWTTRPNRTNQSTADKVRWEYDISKRANQGLTWQ